MNTFAPSVDPNRAAVYIRWSTDEQSEGTTLEVQRESCEHYIRAQGWNLNESLVFIDDGYSGGSMQRPGLTALRKAVRSGKVSCVVVFKLDRLSRSVIDTVNLVLQEWDGLCFLKSTREPVDTTTSAGKMFFYMLASYAEWERSVIRERMLSGRVKRAQQGKNPGYVAPYGYTKGDKPGLWVVNEAEAAIVRRVFAEYASGKGLHVIAAGLYKSGISPRRSNRWHATTIAQMLTNRSYTGLLEYGKSTLTPKHLLDQVGKIRMTFDEPRYATFEGALPVIISTELFERVRQVHDSKGILPGKRTISPDFLLTGIARCTCGGYLRGDSRNARGHRYYRCSNQTLDRPVPCPAGMIPADEIEKAVITEIKTAFNPANREQYVADWEVSTKADIERAETELDGVRESLADIGRQRTKLDKDYDTGDLPAKLYGRRTNELDEDRVRLEAAEKTALKELDKLHQASFNMQEFDSLGSKVDSWEHLLPEERKQVLRFALASCTAFREPVRGRGKVRPSLEVSVTIWRPSARPQSAG